MGQSLGPLDDAAATIVLKCMDMKAFSQLRGVRRLPDSAHRSTKPRFHACAGGASGQQFPKSCFHQFATCLPVPTPWQPEFPGSCLLMHPASQPRALRVSQKIPVDPPKALCLVRSCSANCASLGVVCACRPEFPKSLPYSWPASARLCPQVDQATFPCMCSGRVWTSVPQQVGSSVCHLLASPSSVAA